MSPELTSLSDNSGVIIVTGADFIRVLSRWPQLAGRYWWDDPQRPDLGCFGTGYNSWGVQTNQKFLGAYGVLATDTDLDEAAAGCTRDEILDKALRALRFSLASHVSGDHHCSDGTQWGHTWISTLGIERMMHGVEALQPHLTDSDREGLRRMLVSEADALLELPITGTKWAADGGNRPESNIWNGATLWRVATMYPDESHAGDWTERGHRFMLNGVSIEADATDPTIVAGRPVSARHVGPNFFDHYALDHHGYLNVGYMVICLSNIAMLHFSCTTAGWQPPESLYWHAADLWHLVKRLIFGDGRLARIGGDSRQRYCYCQDYLLPALIFCADHLGDPHAAQLEAGCLELNRLEQEASGDGSFLSARLGTIAQTNPYYYTRLEADKAVVLSMNAYWRRVLGERPGLPAASDDLEASVTGGWIEPEHGAMLHRSPRRLASWSWRAHDAPQGLCLPPDSGHLAEWTANMGGIVRLLGEGGRRTVVAHAQTLFDGGFLTTGTMADSQKAVLPEGWTATERAHHKYAVAALPDDRTMLVLEFCRLGPRSYLGEVKGLKLNVPNDLFNGYLRTYTSAGGALTLDGHDVGERALGGCWVCVDDRIGAVGVYGADGFTVAQAGRRRASGYGDSLYYDELCFPCREGALAVDPGTVVLDCGSAVLSGATAQETARVAQTCAALECAQASVRATFIEGADGTGYVLMANFGDEPVSASIELGRQVSAARNVGTGERVSVADATVALDLAADEAMLLALE